MDTKNKFILVISATGTQGSAIVKALLQKGFRVRIFVRNPDSPAAQELIKLGAEPKKGNFEDLASLEAALEGIDAVYSILPVELGDSNVELNAGRALVKAAKKAGISQFVHASVSNAGTHESFPRWGTGYWNEKYWTDKWEIEEAVRNAGFPSWTILKPVTFMENFMPPIVHATYPNFKDGKIVTCLDIDKKWHLATVEDIAKFGCAALANPEEFNRQNIEIASDLVTLAEQTEILSKVLGKKFELIFQSPEEQINNGINSLIVRQLEWGNAVGYSADMEALKKYNIPLTSFEDWARKNKDRFVV